MISRKERKELDALSKEVFGSSSRWQKIVEYGYEEAVTEEKVEALPADESGKGGENTVHVPVQATNSGGVKYVAKYHTEESIRKFMLDQKKNLEDIRAQIKKHQEDVKTQKEEEARLRKINEENSGSVM